MGWRRLLCLLFGHRWLGYTATGWKTARFCERCGDDTAEENFRLKQRRDARLRRTKTP
jgi:Prophage protein (DUF1660)